MTSFPDDLSLAAASLGYMGHKAHFKKSRCHIAAGTAPRADVESASVVSGSALAYLLVSLLPWRLKVWALSGRRRKVFAGEAEEGSMEMSISQIPYVPSVTASTLPADEILVRASEAPSRGQSEVLLRAAQWYNAVIMIRWRLQTMDVLIEKKVQIADHRAKWLEQLASKRGVTESVLIEEGLDLLLREQNVKDAHNEALQEDWELLQQLETEFGSLNRREPALKIDPNEISSVVGTPIDTARIRRIGERH
jgi:hypothetical protein